MSQILTYPFLSAFASTKNSRITCALLFCLLHCVLFSYSQSTANNYVKPYNEYFQYGSNLVGNRNGWNDTGLTSLVSKAGGHTIRPTLPEVFLDRYGYNIRLNEFQYYTASLGMKEITCFIHQPSPAHADKTIFPGCTQPSKLFANLYQPIWKADGTINTNNYYANYVYKLLQTYGDYVRFWEVGNEPDLTAANPNDWLSRAPLPVESINTQAPIYYYIRTLRITWEVVKKYRPDAYVTTGGIGNSQYLDAILRYTDNPANGAVSAAYPNKGGAYFDVLSYHCYPSYYLRYWDNLIAGFKYTRNSDFAAAKVIDAKNTMQNVLGKYGYNGTTFPLKHFIITETNISRRTRDWRYSSDTMQRNFGMKALVLAQKNKIKQLYFYTVGEQTNAPLQSTAVFGNEEYNLMGLYENLFRDAPGSAKLTQSGIGVKSVSGFLYGYKYDSVRTKALLLPSNAEGGAFRKNSEYVYVLWAKDLLDKSETFSALYSFPSSLGISNLFRSEWDYAVSRSVVKKAPLNLTLTASPSFFKTDTAAGLKSQTITLVPVADRAYSASAFKVQAISTSGLAVAFRKITGNVTIATNMITMMGVGTVIIEAFQAGNISYSPAKVVRDTFVVSKAAQTITFPTIANKILGISPFLLLASSSSGLAVSYSVVSGPATVTGNTIKLTGLGIVTIKAMQSGNGSYLPATPVVKSFAVLAPSITENKFVSKDALPASVIDAPEEVLLQAIPNPVTSNATVQFRVKKTGETSVIVADLQGRTVAILFSGTAYAGVMNLAKMSSAALAPGVYILSMKTSEKMVSKRILISK